MLVVVMKRTEKQPGTRQITDYRSSLVNLWISFIIKADVTSFHALSEYSSG